jgi:hypothetical protein
MSGGEWPADPTDPRCPHCDGKVSATASYCMHCEADLPPADFDPRETADGTDADFVGTSVSEQVSAAAEEFGRSGEDSADSRSIHEGRTGTREETSDDHLIDPDGILDNVSTAMVGVVGGLLAGIVLLPLSIWLFPDPLEDLVLWVAGAGWLAATAWIARTRTVFGAVEKAGLVLGGLLALAPPLAALAAENGVGDVLGATIIFGIFVWPVALVLAGIGWVVGYFGGVDGE